MRETGSEALGAVSSFFSNFGMIMVLVMLLAFTVMLLRYPLRYLNGLLRKQVIGDMVWNEVVFERRHAQGETHSARKQAEAMRGLVEHMHGDYWINRGMLSFVIQKSKEDSKVHLYVGMDEKHYSDDAMQSWADSIDCSIQSVDLPNIYPGGLVTAFRMGNAVSDISDEVDRGDVGSVIEKFQKYSSGEYYGTAIMSIEWMTNSERKFTVSNLSEETIMDQGESAQVSRLGERGIVFNSSPARASLVVVSDNNSKETSKAAMGQVVTGMSKLGTTLSRYTPSHAHRRFIAKWSPLLIPPAILMYLFPEIVPQPFGWSILAFNAILAGIVVIHAPFLSTSWIAEDAKRGVVIIPPFWRFSPRRIVHGLFRKNFMRDAGGEKMGNRVAPASCRQVIPIYKSPIMQFASMPISGSSSLNVSSSSVPKIGIPQSLEYEMEKYDDDRIFLGKTPTGQPIFSTVDELEFGIAIGGDAGSGKSNTILVHYLGMSMLSRSTEGRAGDFVINPVWLETKGEGAYDAAKLVEEYDPLVIHVHDPDSPTRLAIEGRRYSEGATVEEIESNTTDLVDGLISSYGDSIGPQSRDVMIQAHNISMLLSPQEIKAMKALDDVIDPDKPNVALLDYYIVGADSVIKPIDMLKKIAQAMDKRLKDENKRNSIAEKRGKEEILRQLALIKAINRFSTLAERPEVLNPIQNKLSVLAESKGLFNTSPDRRDISFDEIINYGGPVIINMGPVKGEDNNFRVPIGQEMARRFTTVIHYMLWKQIKSKCAGWKDLGKYIPIYADEAKDIAGESKSDAGSMNILQDVRDQGRSRGCCHNIGYQNYQQLPVDARAAVRSFVSTIFLSFTSSEDRDIAMEEVGDRTSFTSENLSYFPMGTGIAKMYIAKNKVRPFTIQTPSVWEWKETLDSSNSLAEAAEKQVQKMTKTKARKKSKKQVRTNKKKMLRR